MWALGRQWTAAVQVVTVVAHALRIVFHISVRTAGNLLLSARNDHPGFSWALDHLDWNWFGSILRSPNPASGAFPLLLFKFVVLVNFQLIFVIHQLRILHFFIILEKSFFTSKCKFNWLLLWLEYGFLLPWSQVSCWLLLLALYLVLNTIYCILLKFLISITLGLSSIWCVYILFGVYSFYLIFVALIINFNPLVGAESVHR